MRQRIEVGETLPSYARDNRLQIKNADWIAATGDGGVNPSGYVAKMRLYGGECNNPHSPPYASMSTLAAAQGSAAPGFACP
ncbi:hypothetical protein OKW39_008590 [Paraburkholderia sp. MM6662-R1]